MSLSVNNYGGFSPQSFSSSPVISDEYTQKELEQAFVDLSLASASDQEKIIWGNTANYYYFGKALRDRYRNIDFIRNTETAEEAEEQNGYEKLTNIIERDVCTSELLNSTELKKYDINFRFGFCKNTLLHAAYKLNKPKVVEFLINNGADERIPNSSGCLPLESANDFYNDRLPRVINEVVQSYFKELKNPCNNDPHLLFNVILKFIQEKKWRYLDKDSSRSIIPFRDSKMISLLGSPELAYHVNCVNLTHLFIKTAHKIGIEAKEVSYGAYQSIKKQEMEKAAVLGKFAFFDGSTNSGNEDVSFLFGQHCVAYSSGWHFDLTLQCKYQNRDSILTKERHVIERGYVDDFWPY